MWCAGAGIIALRTSPPLAQALREKGIAYVDVMDAFERYGKKEGVDRLIPAHYSPLGNKIVARFLFDYLKKGHLLNTGRSVERE